MFQYSFLLFCLRKIQCVHLLLTNVPQNIDKLIELSFFLCIGGNAVTINKMVAVYLKPGKDFIFLTLSDVHCLFSF